MPGSGRPARVPIPRRLPWTRSAAPDGPGAVAARPPESVAPSPDARVDAAFALTRGEVEALVRVADERTGRGHASPATPDRVRSAIEAALAAEVAPGSVVVTRLPRALHSAETWHVRLVSVAAPGRDRVAATISAARVAGRNPAEADRDVL